MPAGLFKGLLSGHKMNSAHTILFPVFSPLSLFVTMLCGCGWMVWRGSGCCTESLLLWAALSNSVSTHLRFCTVFLLLSFFCYSLLFFIIHFSHPFSTYSFSFTKLLSRLCIFTPYRKLKCTKHSWQQKGRSELKKHATVSKLCSLLLDCCSYNFLIYGPNKFYYLGAICGGY